MKKRLLSMLMVVVLMTGMLSMSAFAACETCVDADGDMICDVCTGHVHKAAGYAFDANGHWNVCGDAACAEKLNAAAHAWTKDDAASTAQQNVYNCVCGEVKKECIHSWSAWSKADDKTHTRTCANCPEIQIADHVWSYTGSTGTDVSYKCGDCGATLTEHKHNYGDMTWDGYAHWRACTGCGEQLDWGVHIDANGNGVCDYVDCNHTGMDTSGVVYKQIVISDLDEPNVGGKVDFKATVAPAEFGNATVKWNRVENLSTNASDAMGENNVYAAGKMYNVSLSIYLNNEASFADDFSISLNGEAVTLYKSEAECTKALKAYDGTKKVAGAYINPNVERKLIVCVMYPELSGECAHEWIKMQGQTTHWEECKFCGQLYGGYTKHFDKNANGICDNCGYNIYGASSSTGTGGSHAHSWSTDWVEDISNHWKQCTTCGAKSDVAAHADGNQNGNCDVCGFVMTAAAGHTHSFATTWTETAYQHYHLCECGAKNDIGAHVDKNNSGLCDQCGYTMSAALNAAANGTVANVGGGTGTTTGANGVPATGDSTSISVIALWAAALAVSVVGLGGAMLAWSKRKES